jgi:hypothetical protein
MEIPDKEADAIHSGMRIYACWSRKHGANIFLVDKAVDYILAQPDGNIIALCEQNVKLTEF